MLSTRNDEGPTCIPALMGCGALHRDEHGTPTWVRPARGRRFLFPVRALSKVFRGKFMAALDAARLQSPADGPL